MKTVYVKNTSNHTRFKGDSELYGQDVGPFPRHHFTRLRSQIPPENQALQVSFGGLDEFILGAWRTRKNSNTFALEFVQQGVYEFIQNGKRYECAPGALFIVHLGKDSTMRCLTEYAQKKTISLAGTSLASLLNSLNLAETDVISSVSEIIDELFESTFTLLKECPGGFQKELSVLAYRILLELSGNNEQQNYPEMLRRILHFIEENFATDISIDLLCREFGVSSGTVFRLFREHLKESPIDYVIGLRMRIARCLLLERDVTIKDIAYRTGYRNPLYFSSEFRRIYGLSPREFRKQNFSY